MTAGASIYLCMPILTSADLGKELSASSDFDLYQNKRSTRTSRAGEILVPSHAICEIVNDGLRSGMPEDARTRSTVRMFRNIPTTRAVVVLTANHGARNHEHPS